MASEIIPRGICGHKQVEQDCDRIEDGKVQTQKQ